MVIRSRRPPQNSRDDLAQRRGERQQTALDGLEYQHIGKRFGDRKQAEDRILGDRALLALAAVTEHLVIGGLATALHAD